MLLKVFIVRFFPSFSLYAVSLPSNFFLFYQPAYDFLDPTLQGRLLAAYIIGILAGEVIVFCLIKILETWRERWAERRRLVLEDVGTGLNPVIDDGDWQEVERPSSVKGNSES